jgi:hypothetical protein
MIVDGNGQHFLRLFLANHIFAENLFDLMGLGQLTASHRGFVLHFLPDDIVTQFNAFIADEHVWAGDELPNLMLTLATEGAVQELTVITLVVSIFAHMRSSSEAVACDDITEPLLNY